MSKITPEQEKGAHGTAPTVKIVAEKSDENPEGYVVINETDFNAEEHTLFEEPVEETHVHSRKKKKGKGGEGDGE